MENSLQFISQNFHGLDDMRVQLANMEVDIVPLRSGRYEGSSRSAIADGLVFTLGELDSNHRYRGGTLHDQLLLGIAIGTGARVHYGSSAAQDGDLSVLLPDSEYSGSVSGSHRFASLSVAMSVLERLGAVIGSSDRFWRDNHHVQPPERVRLAAQRAALAVAPLLARPAPPPGEAPRALLERAMVFPFLLAAAFDRSTRSYDSTQSHAHIVRQAELWIDQQPPEKLHVIDLCMALGLPLRTVQRAFHASLGIGPAAYFSYYRLTRVRRHLLACDPTTTRIAEVAFDHGFWEAGRFAGYYRDLYGENPSDTLKRRR